jgi:DNA modification methylase
MEYSEFLETKQFRMDESGFDVPIDSLNPILFEFQRDIVKWALKKGKACIFAGTGLGKTLMQVEWAVEVLPKVNTPILIVAPLAVGIQTIKIALEDMGIQITYAADMSDIRCNELYITNYDRLDKFDLSKFAGIVLDESSILKSYSGKIRNDLTERCRGIPYKLCCTATPAPNDTLEIVNHCEFLEILRGAELLSMFFTHESDDIGHWVLKGHAKQAFWEFVASWAVMLSKPSDLGYSDEGYDLPPLTYYNHTVRPESSPFQGRKNAQTLMERKQARRESFQIRCEKAAEIVNSDPDSAWLIWCDLNSESECLTKMIDGAVEIRGSHSQDYKRDNMIAFSEGKTRILVSKPSICGFGMNWQHCHKMIFVGLSDSFEAYYQAVRRCWRFGQTLQVDVHVVTSVYEGEVVKNIKRKEREFEEMINSMVSATQEITKENLKSTGRMKNEYKTDVFKSEHATLYLGDCIEQIKNIADDSIHFSIFSPPFSSLYTYSNSDRDLGNCRTDEEFMQHFEFLAPELYRILMPGRLVAIHCQLLPMSKSRNGHTGLYDFRGDIIRLFTAAGFIFHTEVTIWKDPVQEMYRTKTIRLLHKQLRKDAAMSGVGRADYLVVMRKPGDNSEPITHETGSDEFIDVPKWQEYASPVWFGINQMNVLNSGRCVAEEEDEKHICPLQLEVVERALELWTNPDDIVFTPFAGIGSEVYEAVLKGRRGIGIELKETYWVQACGNIQKAEKELKTPQVGLDAFNLGGITEQ